ncbi:MAG: hypothetical protein J0H42_18130 [Rhizobiales bacterium]|nr:hypothetical protein [Hyphomicrobiales bacterium]
MATLVVAILVCGTLASAHAQQTRRSGTGPCRQGALSLIAMLDANEDNTPDYRRVYEAVVQTCGPAGMPSAQPPSPREECRKLALAMLDAIEDNKINTQGFVHARTRFATSCAPR